MSDASTSLTELQHLTQQALERVRTYGPAESSFPEATAILTEVLDILLILGVLLRHLTEEKGAQPAWRVSLRV